MLIIAITGNANSGKTTLNNMIKKNLVNYNVCEYIFAEKIKKTCSILFDEPIEYYDDQNKKLLSPEGIKYSRRVIMQKIADFYRSINMEIFLPKLNKFKCDTLLISDMRFLQEYNYIMEKNDKNIIIKLIDNNTIKMNHNSENEIDKIPYTYLIDNTEKKNTIKLEEFVNNVLLSDIKKYI